MDEFPAKRRELWGEAPREGEELPLKFRDLLQEEIDCMDGLQKMVWEFYGRKLPVNEVDRLLAGRRAEALAQLKALSRPLPEGYRFDRDEANE